MLPGRAPASACPRSLPALRPTRSFPATGGAPARWGRDQAGSQGPGPAPGWGHRAQGGSASEQPSKGKRLKQPPAKKLSHHRPGGARLGAARAPWDPLKRPRLRFTPPQMTGSQVPQSCRAGSVARGAPLPGGLSLPRPGRYMISPVPMGHPAGPCVALHTRSTQDRQWGRGTTPPGSRVRSQLTGSQTGLLDRGPKRPPGAP